MRYFLLLSLFLTCSCDLLFGPPAKTQEDTCTLEKKMYPVQFAKRDNTNETYELTLLGTPICFKNPLVLENVRLGRLDQNKSKEKAELDYIDETHSTLYLTSDFQITVTEEKIDANGHTSQASSLWQPLLAGAAGAAIGGIIANKLSGRPQYVRPPSPQKGGSLLKGFDEKQVTTKPLVRKKSSPKVKKISKLTKKKTKPRKKIKKSRGFGSKRSKRSRRR